MRKVNPDARKILWTNVLALMKLRYGKENMSRLATASGVGPATMTRVKEQQTSVGTEKLDQIAKALDVPTWQLLYEGFDFEHGHDPGVVEQAPATGGKDLMYLFDLIPLRSPAREVCYQTCFTALIKALHDAQAASQSTGGTGQAASPKTHTA